MFLNMILVVSCYDLIFVDAKNDDDDDSFDCKEVDGCDYDGGGCCGCVRMDC